mgnify:CR=1 FL=1
MAEVPFSTDELNEIVFKIARDLLEEAAIEGRIEEVTDEDIGVAVNEVVFVIDKYMEYVNELFATKAIASTGSKIQLP